MSTASSGGFPDRGPSVFAVTTATLVLSTVFVVGRTICRFGIVRRVGWDDYFILLAWVLAFGQALTIDIATRNGLGRHDANIVDTHRGSLRRCEYAFSILYNPALMATKTSILIFYLRLSKNTEKVLRLCSWAVLVIVNIAGTVLTIINIFQCRPVHAAFEDAAGKCIPLLTEFICSAPVNIVTDLAILALPLPVLTSMRLPSRQKTILVCTFMLGIFVTVVDVVRIYYLQQAITTVATGTSSDTSAIFGDSDDFSWNASFSLMWSAVEVNVGIICACIPTLKPLIIRILPAMIIDPDGTRGLTTSSGTRDMDTSDASRRDDRQRLAVSGSSQLQLPSSDGPSSQPRQSMSMPPGSGSVLGTGSTLTPPQEARTVGSAVDDVDLGPNVNMDNFNVTGFDLTTAPAASPSSPASNETHQTFLSPPPRTVGRGSKNTSGQSQHQPHQQNQQSQHRSPLQAQPVDINALAALSKDNNPDENEPSGTQGPQSGLTLSEMLMDTGSTIVRSGKTDNTVYFGFVNMKRPKSMLYTSPSESLKYCTLVTILFLLWGFSYGLLNTLNNVVAAVSGMSTGQTLGLTSAYFGGGYLLGPLLVGEWVLRHDEHHRRRAQTGMKPETRRTISSLMTHSHNHEHEDAVGGFKATFMVGLCIYGVGTIMFWPSSVLASFPGFFISSFVVGFGLSVLETAANPFLALCGPMEYSEMRSLIAQGVQATGSVLSGLLAQRVFFVNVSTTGAVDSLTLLDVQWTYLAVTLFCVALAMFFYYMPLPEVHDAELDRAARQLKVDSTKRSLGGLQLRTTCLVAAVLAQWVYVAAQESMSIYFSSILTVWLPDGSTATTANTVSHVASRILSGVSDSPLFPQIVSHVSTSSARTSDDSDHPAGLDISIPNYLLVARTAFAISRYTAGCIAYLAVRFPKCRWIPSPRSMLTICSSLTALCALLTVVIPRSAAHGNANLIVAPVVLFFLFEGPIWPIIFAMGLRGQGARTKRAAAWLTVGASGPLFWPFVMYGITEGGGSTQVSFIVIVVLMAVSTLYPLYLTFVRDARELTQVTGFDLLAAAGDAPGDQVGGGALGGLGGLGALGGIGELNDVGGLGGSPIGGKTVETRGADAGIPAITIPDEDGEDDARRKDG